MGGQQRVSGGRPPLAWRTISPKSGCARRPTNLVAMATRAAGGRARRANERQQRRAINQKPQPRRGEPVRGQGVPLERGAEAGAGLAGKLDFEERGAAVGAAAGLGYAGLLVQTPLGILSNMLLVPLLPVFARLTAPGDRPELVTRIRQGLMASSATMLPLGALMVALAEPIVALVYERGAFDVQAARLVVGLLMAYGVGMPAYLCRDVLVRVFYALGDGTTPFRFSMAGIDLNVLFDWLLVGGPTPWGLQLPALNFGAPGLVLATVAVNVITCLLLLLALQTRLGGLPLRRWGRDSLLLLGSAVLAGLVAWCLASTVPWPAGLVGKVLNCGVSGGLGLGVYGLLASAAGVQEARQLTVQLRRQLAQRLKPRP
jgi:putative peptidoglycan lipid II flippase